MAENDTTRIIKDIFVFPNGMVAVCDQFGQQMPTYQGTWAEMQEAILRDKPAHAEIHR